MAKKNKDTFYSNYLVFLIIAILIIISEKIVIITPLRSVLESILLPPAKFTYNFKRNSMENINLILSKDNRNKIIKSDEYYKESEVLKLKIRTLEEENKNYRRQLEMPLPVSWDYIPAKVLGYERFLIVDKGNRDGVKNGMIVISENILVGKINQVSEKSSQVMILGDSNMKIPAKTNKNVRGLTIGEFGNEIIFTRVLQRDSLNEFDLVMTSGEDGVFPSDLIIGKIGEVIAKQEDVYKEAKVNPLLDFGNLINVFIVANY